MILIVNNLAYFTQFVKSIFNHNRPLNEFPY